MKRILSILIVVAVVFAVVAFAGGCKSHHWRGHEDREHGMWMHGRPEHGMQTGMCPCCGKEMQMNPMMMQRMEKGMCPMCGAPMDKEHMKAMMEKMKMPENAPEATPPSAPGAPAPPTPAPAP